MGIVETDIPHETHVSVEGEHQTIRCFNDDELWDQITGHAERRSGEYVPVDDLELQLSPFSPSVEETNNNILWNG